MTGEKVKRWLQMHLDSELTNAIMIPSSFAGSFHSQVVSFCCGQMAPALSTEPVYTA
jgi:hypothetical protein